MQRQIIITVDPAAASLPAPPARARGSMVRLSGRAHERLKTLARWAGMPMTRLLEAILMAVAIKDEHGVIMREPAEKRPRARH